VEILLRSSLWSRSLPPISVGWRAAEVSYCISKKRPALEAVGVVTDFVVVRVSKTNAAKDSFFDKGVAEYSRRAERRCDLSVVLPDPVSPLLRC
jgi:hypothetical protein